jgi:hypothetical protein
MLSLCKPQQFYQVLFMHLCTTQQIINHDVTQIFLAQGLGAGLAAGTVYIPSVAVVSHYFQKRRAFAMSIVASGSSLGAVIHPIMLNNTFHRLGFANAVRASAGLVSGMLLIACLLMRPRLPPPKTNPQFFKSLRRFGRDRAFVFLTAAMSTYTIGFCFPLFYLQLDAVTHGIDQTFAFYSVRQISFTLSAHFPLNVIDNLPLARYPQRIEFLRSPRPGHARAEARCAQHGHRRSRLRRRPHPGHDRPGQRRQRRGHWCHLWILCGSLYVVFAFHFSYPRLLSIPCYVLHSIPPLIFTNMY